MSETSPNLKNKLIVYGSYRKMAGGLQKIASRKALRDHYKFINCNIKLTGYIMISLKSWEAIAIQVNDPYRFIMADIVYMSDEMLKCMEIDLWCSNKFHQEIIIYDDEMYSILLGKCFSPEDEIVKNGDWVDFKDDSTEHFNIYY